MSVARWVILLNVAVWVGLAIWLWAPPRLILCRMGRHTWVEWTPYYGGDGARCRHCLRWRAGRAPRR